MFKKIHKLLFALNITDGLPSLASLLWNSKRLRWNKTGVLKTNSPQAITTINIQHPLGNRKLHLRTYAGDIDIFYEVFFKEIYALQSVDPSQVKVIVDLGANVGLSALYFLKQYPAAQVICVEPEASNFAMLSKNLQKEITSGKVQALQAAAMGEDGFVSFESADAKYNSRVKQDGASKNIPAIGIPTLMQRCGISYIHLLKIDVEGAEKFVLGGDIAWLDKVDNVLIELHSDEDRAVCMRAFERYQFQVVSVDADASNENLLWASRGQ